MRAITRRIPARGCQRGKGLAERGGSRGGDVLTKKPLNRLARLNRTAARNEHHCGALVVLWRWTTAELTRLSCSGRQRILSKSLSGLRPTTAFCERNLAFAVGFSSRKVLIRSAADCFGCAGLSGTILRIKSTGIS